MSREAMQKALDALESRCGTNADERGPDGAITALRAALEAGERNLDAGWVFVPLEPTPEMHAAMSAYDGTSYSNPFDADDFRSDYAAMIAAAQQEVTP